MSTDTDNEEMMENYQRVVKVLEKYKKSSSEALDSMLRDMSLAAVVGAVLGRVDGLGFGDIRNTLDPMPKYPNLNILAAKATRFDQMHELALQGELDAERLDSLLRPIHASEVAGIARTIPGAPETGGVPLRARLEAHALILDRLVTGILETLAVDSAEPADTLRAIEQLAGEAVTQAAGPFELEDTPRSEREVATEDQLKVVIKFLEELTDYVEENGFIGAQELCRLMQNFGEQLKAIDFSYETSKSAM